MASNFGKTIQVSTFGASHGYAIGGIVEGLFGEKLKDS